MFSHLDLVVLLAVADTGSIRGAATALRRTQPSVTKAIQRLEDVAGFPLLDRSSYRARLTEHGETFVERARMLVTQARSLHTFAALISNGAEPRLRIGVDSAVPQETWVALLRRVTATSPHTEIEVESGEGDALLPRLLDGELDLAILFHVSVQRHGIDLERKLLGEAEFSNVVRTDKAASLKEGIALLPQILVVDFADPLAAHGMIKEQRYWRVNNYQMQVALILEGLGWGTAPRALIQQQLNDGTVSALAYRGLSERSSHSFSLYRRRDVIVGPATTSIWQSAGDIRPAGTEAPR